MPWLSVQTGALVHASSLRLSAPSLLTERIAPMLARLLGVLPWPKSSQDTCDPRSNPIFSHWPPTPKNLWAYQPSTRQGLRDLSEWRPGNALLFAGISARCGSAGTAIGSRLGHGYRQHRAVDRACSTRNPAHSSFNSGYWNRARGNL
ncbi:hypothetical protein SJA_C1-18220 [Sphingobium indicum UT26S]|uniref:Uncharacterized protein n=1 Tax=Sphingobium indicum (strain DSM 16413 / CCM 7287 / MTCC 6362 / UT26 / NBRC 101211 / UT26S) TaxID=452662 RepID=D4Z224_SPHIU|nr:hypothetical protein SJA_C1-18220 [Sphingobium indicum UT26S]